MQQLFVCATKHDAFQWMQTKVNLHAAWLTSSHFLNYSCYAYRAVNECSAIHYSLGEFLCVATNSDATLEHSDATS
jgi:hypothetical protein